MSTEKDNHKCTMDKIISLCKRRGFVYQASEIYGGQAGAWDYGPLGVDFKRNIQNAWWKEMTQLHDDVVGLDGSIFMHHTTWEASGHLKTFSDPLIDCKKCKTRHRADKLLEDAGIEDAAKYSNDELVEMIKEKGIKCPNCGAQDFTDIRNFNLMFKTFQGVTEDNKNTVYLRPETAQGIFVNYTNVQRSMRLKLPFGVGQIGKSFRNEITPGNFIFRVREFDQMELEFFCKPGTELEWHKYYKDFCFNYLLCILSILYQPTYSVLILPSNVFTAY